MPNLRELQISNCDLRFLPKNMFSHKQLEWLDLSGNRLQLYPSEMPIWFLDMPQLLTLILNDNVGLKLDQWANWIQFGRRRAVGSRHLRLRRIEVVNCGIDQQFMVTGLCGFRVLTHLVLGSESISELPDSNRRKNLLFELPEGISELKMLTHLIAPNLAMSELPEALGELKMLTYVDFSHNELHWLPQSLDQLFALKFVNLSHNRFGDIPYQLESLRELEKLNLSFNNITWLPSDLAKLNRKLLHLDLYSNKLNRSDMESLQTFNLSALEELDLAANDLSLQEVCQVLPNYVKLQDRLRQSMLLSTEREDLETYKDRTLYNGSEPDSGESGIEESSILNESGEEVQLESDDSCGSWKFELDESNSEKNGKSSETEEDDWDGTLKEESLKPTRNPGDHNPKIPAGLIDYCPADRHQTSLLRGSQQHYNRCKSPKYYNFCLRSGRFQDAGVEDF